VNNTFLQPFLAQNTKKGFGVIHQAESTYSIEFLFPAHQMDLAQYQFISRFRLK